jgi:hypothetical protein
VASTADLDEGIGDRVQRSIVTWDVGWGRRLARQITGKVELRLYEQEVRACGAGSRTKGKAWKMASEQSQPLLIDFGTRALLGHEIDYRHHRGKSAPIATALINCGRKRASSFPITVAKGKASGSLSYGENSLVVGGGDCEEEEAADRPGDSGPRQ